MAKKPTVGNKNKIVWSVFVFTIIIVIIDVIVNLAGFGLESIGFINWITLFSPVILLFIHACWTLTFSRGIVFILLSGSIGYLYEVLGVKYGVLFGGGYYYDPHHLGVSFLGVPLLIPLFWAVFIYTGYTISNSFLSWSTISKPVNNKSSVLKLLILIISDAFLVVSIDLFMDPLLVYVEFWTWVTKGPYFGIPIGNFIGWGVVTIIVSGVFRTYEYYFPKNTTDLNKVTQLIPVLGYIALCLTFFLCALSIEFTSLAAVGMIIMMPVGLFNFWLFYKSRVKASE